VEDSNCGGARRPVHARFGRAHQGRLGCPSRGLQVSSVDCLRPTQVQEALLRANETTRLPAVKEQPRFDGQLRRGCRRQSNSISVLRQATLALVHQVTGIATHADLPVGVGPDAVMSRGSLRTGELSTGGRNRLLQIVRPPSGSVQGCADIGHRAPLLGRPRAVGVDVSRFLTGSRRSGVARCCGHRRGAARRARRGWPHRRERLGSLRARLEPGWRRSVRLRSRPSSVRDG
jgi:hypothetical protein